MKREKGFDVINILDQEIKKLKERIKPSQRGNKRTQREEGKQSDGGAANGR